MHLFYKEIEAYIAKCYVCCCALSYIVCLYFVKLWKAYVFPRSGRKGGDEKRLACFVWVFLVCTGSSISQKVTIFSLLFFCFQKTTLWKAQYVSNKNNFLRQMQLFQFWFLVAISWYLLSCCKEASTCKKCAKNFLTLLCSRQIFIFLEKLTKNKLIWKISTISFVVNSEEKILKQVEYESARRVKVCFVI